MTGLSIVIASWNTREMLAACLQSVYGAQGSLDLDTIVVDNASGDGSVDLVRERFPQASLIANPTNAGFARANNQGIRQSCGHYILLLNSDTKVHPGALEAVTAFMDRHPQAGTCGPLLLSADGSLQVSCYLAPTPMREFWRLSFLDQVWRRASYDQLSWDRHTPRRVDAIKGACLVLRREALDEVGLLDESYFMYTEEIDLCHRLGQAGWQVWWVPQAVVTHYGGASSSQVSETMYVQLYRSKVQFHRKLGGARRAAWFKLLLYLAYTPRWFVAAVGGLFSGPMATRARTYRRLLVELARM